MKKQNSSGSDSSSSANSSTSSRNSSNNHNNDSNRRPQQQQRRRLSSSQQALFEYVPDYLRPFLHPYHGEYCYTPIFQARFIAQLMAEGFLPVATSGMLLPKLHVQRSVISLPDGLHISKSVRKKHAKRFSLTVNTRFDEVIQGCHDQHGSHCWLYPPLVAAFREMFHAGRAMEASAMDPITGRPLPGRTWKVRLYTIEVWNEATGALAGGELGYTVGSIYTSLTGFTKEDSAGSVQLAALGRLLSEQGFQMWDLGMDMEYKQGIGSQAMPRETFVREVHRVRETQGHLVLPANQPAQNCREIIDRNAPPATQQQHHQQQQQSKKKKTPKQATKPAKDNNTSTTGTSAPASAPVESKGSTKAHIHTPPVSGAGAPTKKKVRKSDSQDQLE